MKNILYLASLNMRIHYKLMIRFIFSFLVIFLSVSLYFSYLFAITQNISEVEENYQHLNSYITQNYEPNEYISTYADIIEYNVFKYSKFLDQKGYV